MIYRNHLLFFLSYLSCLLEFQDITQIDAMVQASITDMSQKWNAQWKKGENDLNNSNTKETSS